MTFWQYISIYIYKYPDKLLNNSLEYVYYSNWTWLCCFFISVKQISLPILKQGTPSEVQQKVDLPAAEQAEVKPEKQQEEKPIQKKPKKEKVEKKGIDKKPDAEGANRF